ncbi:hypothetical protein NSQ77_11705 [Oceanobacillus sp. FSL K6-2867]|uniref:hypothetical protein n=1 Tax=Oceanobacillus sp. FSL K6-2867 TaxID=2954748 RepID=UPI0030DCF6BF
MHTIYEMGYKDYEFELDGQASSLEEIFPNFNADDRIGVVTLTPGGTMGANALIMSALTRFYDFYREELGDEAGKLRIYPDYFVFHVGKLQMNHTMVDIWPPHKDVIVEVDDPEQILEAINDRGITRLVVEDIPATTPTFLRETVSSAKRRIVSALAYSPSGRVENADVTIKSCPSAEKNLIATLGMTEEISDEYRELLKRKRQSLVKADRIVETYRRIQPSSAVKMLTTSTKVSDITRSYMKTLGNKDHLFTSSW